MTYIRYPRRTVCVFELRVELSYHMSRFSWGSVPFSYIKDPQPFPYLGSYSPSLFDNFLKRNNSLLKC